MRAIERDPPNAAAYHRWAALQADRSDRALKIIEAGIQNVSLAQSRTTSPPPHVKENEMQRLRLIRADILWDLQRKEEALSEFKALLAEDPSDQLGVRKLLIPLCISDGRLDDAEMILDRFKETDTFALWNRTLIAYARGGAAAARPFLETARKKNPHVPDALTGWRYEYDDLPETFSPGSSMEAVIYAEHTENAWRAVKGAKQWIRGK